MGDFNQRIQDQERIEEFLTSQGLLTIFSIVTFSVFFGILWYYDYSIVIAYVSFTAVSIFGHYTGYGKGKYWIILSFNNVVKIKKPSMK